MNCLPISRRLLLVSALLILSLLAASIHAAEPVKVVLLSGSVQEVDRPGHHDYLGGCLLLEKLLAQTSGVETVLIRDGWPEDESVFEGAATIVSYTDGGGKQAYFQNEERTALMQQLMDRGTGLVCIHQAVEFPPSHSAQSGAWLGALYSKAFSGRGHWDSTHSDFPAHPVTRGVTSWEINDGWLNGFKFAKEGVTPLVWSGKAYQGKSEGGDKDVVGWTYDRPTGGRSVGFSGLDAHSAWEHAGMRKLIVNAVLWSAGAEIPSGGSASDADKALVDSLITPRTPPPPKKKAK